MSTLKEIRLASGLSQVALAYKAGVSRFRLSLAEAGTIQLRPDELQAIKSAVRPGMEERARVVSQFDRELTPAEA